MVESAIPVGRSIAVLVVISVLVCNATVVGVVAGQSLDASNVTAERTGQQQAIIANVSFAGQGTFVHNGTRTIWQTSTVNITTTIENPDDSGGQFDVCARIEKGGNTTCTSAYVDGKRGDVVLEFPPQDNLTTGRHDLSVTITSSIGELDGPTDTKTIPVLIADKQGDLDLDRLSNIRERRRGLNMTNPDMDGDGLLDGDEIDRYGTDPTEADSDDDNARDGVEVSGPSNATLPDTDGDGLKDGLELELGLNTTNEDTDGDGLTDAFEYNGMTDPDEADTDGDGLDDGTELDGPTNATLADTDGDGLDDGREMKLGTDPTEPDTDGDFLRDGLEVTLGTNPTSALETLLKGLLLVGVLAALTYLFGRRFVEGRPSEDASASDPSTDSTDPMANGQASTETAATTTQEPDPELLPPDERVEKLLAAENGRMRQAEIVEATDWSKAKVSRTLSGMEDDGAITRFQLGRENVVTLAEEDSANELGPDSG